jgi:hypothetical protein
MLLNPIFLDRLSGRRGGIFSVKINIGLVTEEGNVSTETSVPIHTNSLDVPLSEHCVAFQRGGDGSRSLAKLPSSNFSSLNRQVAFTVPGIRHDALTRPPITPRDTSPSAQVWRTERTVMAARPSIPRGGLFYGKAPSAFALRFSCGDTYLYAFDVLRTASALLPKPRKSSLALPCI